MMSSLSQDNPIGRKLSGGRQTPGLKINRVKNESSVAKNGATSVQRLVLSTINTNGEKFATSSSKVANKNNNNLVNLEESTQNLTNSEIVGDICCVNKRNTDKITNCKTDDGSYELGRLFSTIDKSQTPILSSSNTSTSSVLTASRQSIIITESMHDSTSSISQHSTQSLVSVEPETNASKLSSFVSKLFRKRKLGPINSPTKSVESLSGSWEENAFVKVPGRNTRDK